MQDTLQARKQALNNMASPGTRCRSLIPIAQAILAPGTSGLARQSSGLRTSNIIGQSTRPRNKS